MIFTVMNILIFERKQYSLWIQKILAATWVCVLLTVLCQIVFAQDDRGVGNKLAISDVTGERKIALVIGNTNYDNSVGALKNPVNDAKDVAEALQRLGFTLVGGKAQLDLGKKKMLELIREFGEQIKQGGVGVFYFSGHGVQVDKRNYLIPITDTLYFEEDAQSDAVDVDTVTREMQAADNRLNILILDACRNNNLRKRVKDTEKGLTEPTRKPEGTFIVFAANDGQTASDGVERNGLFTQELLKYLEKPNLRLDDIFRITRSEVKRLSGGRQVPVLYDSTSEAIILKLAENNTTPVKHTVVPNQPDPGKQSNVITESKPVSSNGPIDQAKVKEAESFLKKAEKAKTYDQQIAFYTKAIEVNPFFARAYFGRGNRLYIFQTIKDEYVITIPNNKERYDNALTDLNKAIELDPKFVEAYKCRGALFRKLGEYESSRADFNEIIKINISDSEAYNGRGLAYLEEKKYDSAIADFTKTAQLDPRASYAYFNRGICYLRQNKNEESIVEFTNAIKLTKSGAFYSARADAYEKIGRKDLAEADKKNAKKYKDK